MPKAMFIKLRRTEVWRLLDMVRKELKYYKKKYPEAIGTHQELKRLERKLNADHGKYLKILEQDAKRKIKTKAG